MSGVKCCKELQQGEDEREAMARIVSSLGIGEHLRTGPVEWSQSRAILVVHRTGKEQTKRRREIECNYVVQSV